ncbi:MAG: MoxR family ATPase [Chloroflexota bacterium]
MVAAPTETQTSITESLGIRGWAHLDAVLLAALATKAPLLLIGPHGTGKSQLIEQVAHALDLEFRHYNAALLNYDDIIGIPMPTDDGEELRFIKSPGTIWDAGFVFLDEISRCRADLQNKLFPIIHERRVVGIQLDDLQHRWSAMNPPAPEEIDATTSQYYIGSEPLDQALTDRFPFIVPVPTWAEIDRDDRRELVKWQDNGSIATQPIDLIGLVHKTEDLIPQVEEEMDEWLSDYTVCLVDFLESNGLTQSPRRARMLARSVAAVHAARIALYGEDIEPEESAETAVLYGLPQTATDTPPAAIKVVAVHKQAWELAQHLGDEIWRQVIEERDPAKRVALADELGFSDENLSRLITQVIGSEDSDPRQIGMAVGMFLKFSRTRGLDPSAFEPLAQLSYHVLEPRVINYNVQPNTPEATTWDEITTWLNGQINRGDTHLFRLQRNYILYGFPEFWRKANWQQALDQFTRDLEVFGITEESK